MLGADKAVRPLREVSFGGGRQIGRVCGHTKRVRISRNMEPEHVSVGAPAMGEDASLRLRSRQPDRAPSRGNAPDYRFSQSFK